MQRGISGWRPFASAHAGGDVFGALGGCCVLTLFVHYNHSSRSLAPQSDLLEYGPAHTPTSCTTKPAQVGSGNPKSILQFWIAGSRQTKLMRWWLSCTDRTTTDAHLRHVCTPKPPCHKPRARAAECCHKREVPLLLDPKSSTFMTMLSFCACCSSGAARGARGFSCLGSSERGQVEAHAARL